MYQASNYSVFNTAALLLYENFVIAQPYRILVSRSQTAIPKEKIAVWLSETNRI